MRTPLKDLVFLTLVKQACCPSLQLTEINWWRLAEWFDGTIGVIYAKGKNCEHGCKKVRREGVD